MQYDKELWANSAAQIKEIRDACVEEEQGVCPVSGLKFSDEAMSKPVLDHAHDDGFVRGCLSSRSNLFEGRAWKYWNKLFKGTNCDYAETLIKLGEYLKREPHKKLHGEIVQAEKRRVARWRIETLHSKLIAKGVDLKDVSEYNKHQITEEWLQQFIKEKESLLKEKP